MESSKVPSRARNNDSFELITVSRSDEGTDDGTEALPNTARSWAFRKLCCKRMSVSSWAPRATLTAVATLFYYLIRTTECSSITAKLIAPHSTLCLCFTDG